MDGRLVYADFLEASDEISGTSSLSASNNGQVSNADSSLSALTQEGAPCIPTPEVFDLITAIGLPPSSNIMTGQRSGHGHCGVGGHGHGGSTEKKSGIFGASANMVNTIVGGIVGMPYAFNLCGFWTGLYLLIVTAFLADKSMEIIVDVAKFHPRLRHENVQTYEALAYYPFGKFGEKCVIYITFGMAYGALVSFLIIVKDTLPIALGFYPDSSYAWSAEIVLFLTCLFVILPLSLQKDLASLSFTSLVSVISTLCLLSYVVWSSPVAQSITNAGGYMEVMTTDIIKPTFLMGLGIFADGFACQHAAFVLSGSVRNLTRRRWGVVSFSGMFFTLCMFMIMGITGYLGFFDKTEGDILNNFPTVGIFGHCSRFLLALTMCFTYPLEVFVARHVLTQIVYGDTHTQDELAEDNKQRRLIMTLAVFVMTFIPAALLDDLGIILALTGTVGATSMAYIGPGLIFLGVHGDEFLSLVSRAFANVLRIVHRRGACIDPHEGKNKGQSPTSDRTGRTTEDYLDIELSGLRSPSVIFQSSSPSSIFDISTISSDVERNTPSPVFELSNPSPALYYLEVKDNLVSSKEDNVLWYVLGMPLWCFVASQGKFGMDQRLNNSSQESNYVNVGENMKVDTNISSRYEMPKPTPWDFVVAILFVVYGTMALFGGLAFELYAEIKGVEHV